MNIELFLTRLHKVRITSNSQWMACCPSHDDNTPSLSVSLTEDGRILLHCHAGCDVDAILRSLQLEMKDLYPKPLTTPSPPRKKTTATQVDEGFVGTWEEFLAGPYPDLPGFIDWEELYEGPPYVQQWLAPYFIPKGKLITFYGPPKLGKSLFALEAAAAIASGKDFLGLPTQQAKVLYLDFENHPESDIKPRLQAMGYEYEEIKDLLFLSFPDIEFLDSPSGGKELYDMVKRHNIELVIIDTIARIIEGKENDNDTWNDLEKYTERLLKRDGITFLRIDHTGKDTGKGPRGGSAKQGDVDITWLIEPTKDGKLRLKSDSHRFPLEHSSLTIGREQTPVLHHELVSSNRRLAPDERVEMLANLLDKHEYPTALTVKETAEELRALGERISNDVASSVARMRQERTGFKSPTSRSTAPSSRSANRGTWGWSGGSDIFTSVPGTRNAISHTLCSQRFHRSAYVNR